MTTFKRRLLMGGLGVFLALSTSACHVPGHIPEIDLSGLIAPLGDLLAALGLGDVLADLTDIIGDLLPDGGGETE